jgi:hypothetical protein
MKENVIDVTIMLGQTMNAAVIGVPDIPYQPRGSTDNDQK